MNRICVEHGFEATVADVGLLEQVVNVSVDETRELAALEPPAIERETHQAILDVKRSFDAATIRDLRAVRRSTRPQRAFRGAIIRLQSRAIAAQAELTDLGMTCQTST